MLLFFKVNSLGLDLPTVVGRVTGSLVVGGLVGDGLGLAVEGVNVHANEVI